MGFERCKVSYKKSLMQAVEHLLNDLSGINFNLIYDISYEILRCALTERLQIVAGYVDETFTRL